MASVLAPPRDAFRSTLLLSPADEARRVTAVRLPRLLHDLSVIQRHVLGRIAVHDWAHDGAIPFVAPNAHQLAVALGLAAPGVRLLEVTVSPISFQPFFHLTRLGGYVVRRLFHLVQAREDQRRELEFTKMCQVMQNAWEAHD